LVRYGIEPIQMQMSGGHLLPPVQTLVATLIFCKAENANRFRLQIFSKDQIQAAGCSLVATAGWSETAVCNFVADANR
jgi:hypothetical protein